MSLIKQLEKELPEFSKPCECPKPVGKQPVYCERHKKYKGKGLWSLCQKSADTRAFLDTKPPPRSVVLQQVGLGDFFYVLMDITGMHRVFPFCRECNRRRRAFNDLVRITWKPLRNKIAKYLLKHPPGGKKISKGCGSCSEKRRGNKLNCKEENVEVLQNPPKESVEVSEFFDAVFCISLREQPEKIEAFRKEQWPWKEVRFWIVDRRKDKPKWWKAGPGAWGCMQSHKEILQYCKNSRNIDKVLILEDDARPCKDFASRLEEFLKEVPDDWQWLYLGGQHRFLKCSPISVSPNVVVPFDVNRTHAYAVQGEFIEVLLRWITRLENGEGVEGHHIDHHYGELHQKRKFKVYCPKNFLIGQRRGTSNISRRHFPADRFWNSTRLFVVLGTHRSGSSMVAGMLHKLGVYFGPDKALTGWESSHSNGGFEHKNLAQMLEKRTPFPSTEITEKESIVKQLTGLIRHLKRMGTDVGLKYPQLSLYLEELKEAASNEGLETVFVLCDRSLVESCRSMINRADVRKKIDAGKFTPSDVERHQNLLFEKTRGIKPALILDYETTLSDPQKTVETICETLDLDPDEESIKDAVEHVKPEKRTQKI